MNAYGVIMAGGSGTRLWPLSRKKSPKQLLDLFGTGSLLKQTILRLDGVIDRDRILVVGCEEQREMLRDEVCALIPRENLILEPIGRNTAACIALGGAYLQKAKNAVMCVFPADQYIADLHAFRDVIRHAVQTAEQSDCIATIGITPTYAATEYGYLCAAAPPGRVEGAYDVKRFVEKPDEEHAHRYLEEGNYFWNGGMFISKVNVMMHAIAEHLPNIHAGVQRTYMAQRKGDDRSAREIYLSLPSISIDYGVMEHRADLVVFPGNFRWSDVGSFEALHTIAPQDENGNAILSGTCLGIDAHGLTIHTDKPVVALGVEDLVVIDTKDVLFLCKTCESQRMKDVLGSLRVSGLNELM